MKMAPFSIAMYHKSLLPCLDHQGRRETALWADCPEEAKMGCSVLQGSQGSTWSGPNHEVANTPPSCGVKRPKAGSTSDFEGACTFPSRGSPTACFASSRLPPGSSRGRFAATESDRDHQSSATKQLVRSTGLIGLLHFKWHSERSLVVARWGRIIPDGSLSSDVLCHQGLFFRSRASTRLRDDRFPADHRQLPGADTRGQHPLADPRLVWPLSVPEHLHLPETSVWAAARSAPVITRTQDASR